MRRSLTDRDPTPEPALAAGGDVLALALLATSDGGAT